jgi:hypothetical protein
MSSIPKILELTVTLQIIRTPNIVSRFEMQAFSLTWKQQEIGLSSFRILSPGLKSESSAGGLGPVNYCTHV